MKTDSVTRTKHHFIHKNNFISMVFDLNVKITENVGQYHLLFHHGKFLTWNVNLKI